MANISSIKLPSGNTYDVKDILGRQSIPYGIVTSNSTTIFTATVDGVTQLSNGVCCLIRNNNKQTSASGWTLNVNGLGAKPVYNNMADASRETTIFNKVYTMLFVYDEDRVDGGCWICYKGYDSNTNTIGYQLRTNSTVMNVSDTARYYKLYFTSADNTMWVPASVNSTNNATAARPVNQRPINPFGRIVYTSANTNYTAGSDLAATTIWDQYAFSLGYSFNRTGAALTMTVEAPVYVKCAPQSDGSAIMDADTPIVQALPSTADGKIYIYLGVAYSAVNIELVPHHPVYYHDGTAIRLWTGASGSSSVAWSDITGKPTFATVATSGSYNDLSNKPTIPSAVTESTVAGWGFTKNTGTYSKPSGGIPKTDLAGAVQTSLGKADTALQSFTESDPTVPAWAKQSSKPAYTASEVGALPDSTVIPSKTSDLTNDSGFITSTTADSTYVPKTKTQNYHTNSITYNSGQYSSSIIIKSDGFSNQAGIGVYANDNGYPNATIFVGDISSTNTFITGQNSSGTYATINTTETTINGVVTPTTDGMAANKKYVDDSISNLATVATSGSYNDLSNKPTIPTVPTNVSAFTNDAGYITSYTETDPVFSASAAAGITSANISGWNAKATKTVLTATIAAADWTSSDPYTNTVSVSGLLATDTPTMDLVASSTYATAQNEIADYAYIYKATCSANTLTVYATSAPTIDLSVQLVCVR